MVSKESKIEIRRNKHRRIRNRFSGTPDRPRLAVFRSNNHMYAQIIDDTVGNTLVSASTLQKEVNAKRALEKGITTVVFDRGGFIYQGKIQALAEAAREAGLEF